jgi:hypothetical protein
MKRLCVVWSLGHGIVDTNYGELNMLEIIGFFAAGGALGGASAWLHNRQPSTLVVLGGLYTIALAVCFVVSHATQVGMMAFVAPYVLVAIAASIWSAGLAIHWPVLAERAGALAAGGRGRDAAA